MNKRISGGFTLIEMMVVIVILGVLTTVLVVSFAGKDDKAKKMATMAIIEEVSNAIEEFKMEHHRYPQSLDDLRKKPSYIDDDDWTGKYLKKPAKDGWNRDLLYEVGGSGDEPFRLTSLGADGKPGGRGFDKDLSNIVEDE